MWQMTYVYFYTVCNIVQQDYWNHRYLQDLQAVCTLAAIYLADFIALRPRCKSFFYSNLPMLHIGFDSGFTNISYL